MSADRMKLVEEVFAEVVNADRADRTRLLNLRCCGDTELIAEVRSLIEHNDDAGDRFLSASDMRALASLEPETALQVGVRVAGYTILGVLGKGGMGMVYLAQQERPRRTVALKLVRSALASPSTMRRLSHEAEVLGLLQHPGIAQIFEAGTAATPQGNQPYIAMEYVDGPSLNRYVKQKNLSIAQRVELMARVCEAVHHAHQRGVIHRDLKPGNILVDKNGQPKVLDFGVSRAVDPDLRVTTMQTSAGQLIGTLAYMSPEQAAGNADQVDVRADVYALGVVLYELLSDHLPFDIASRSIPEAARVIHDEEPKRLTAFGKIFRGDLEVIAAKSLEKDRERRYQSAAALGDDLLRHLNGVPIAAKQDSTFYVLRKQIGRHKVSAAAIAAFLITGMTLGIHAGFQAVQNQRLAQSENLEKLKAQEALAVAQREQARADANADRVTRELRASNIERGRLLGITGSIGIAEDAIWPELIRDPDSVHAYWALWELYSIWPCRATIWARQGTIRSIGFSPDGSRVLTGGEDGTTRLWDPLTLEAAQPVSKSAQPVICSKYTPDGSHIVLCNTDGDVEVLRAADLSCESDFHDLMEGVRSMVVSPDGRLIALCNGVGGVQVHRMSDGEMLWQSGYHSGIVFHLAFSPDGTRLASAGDDSTIRIWNVQDGRDIDILRAHRGSVSAVAWSPDGRWIASGGSDRTVKVWDVAWGVPISTVSPAMGTISHVEFDSASKHVAASGWWRVDVYDLSDMSTVAAFTGHRRGASALEFSPDGRTVATGSIDTDLRLWDLPSRLAPIQIPAHTNRLTVVAFNADQSRMITAGFDRSVILWDAKTNTQIAKFTGGGAYDTSAVFIGDGSRFAYVTQSGRVDVRRSLDGTPDCYLRGLPRVVTAIAAAPDGSTLFVADGRQILTRWDVATGVCTGYFPCDGRDPLDFRVSPDGSRLDSTQRDYVIQSWSLPSMESMVTIRTQAPTWCLGISPDSTRMAVGNWQSEIEIYDAIGRNRIALLEGHRQLVASLNYTKDGRYLLSSSNDGTIKLWDALEYRCMLTLQTPTREGIYCSTLAPDGHTVAAGGYDGNVFIWDLRAFDRHIAGNIESQVRKRSASGASSEFQTNIERLRAWSRAMLESSGDDAASMPIGGPSAVPPVR